MKNKKQMNKYFLALAFIFMFAIQGFKSMQEEMEMEEEMEEEIEMETEQRGPPGAKPRPQVCPRREYNNCLQQCRRQRKPMCWCAWRRFGFPKYQCMCKQRNRPCPPFPRF